MFGFDEPNPTAVDSDSQTDSTLQAAKDKLSAFTRPFKRERKTATGASDETSRSPRQATLPQEFYEPKAWEPIVRAPFVLLELATGSKAFQTTKLETEILAASTAESAKYFLVNVHPKWVVLFMFSFNWSVVLGQKCVAYMIEQKERQKRETVTVANNGKQ